MPSRFAEVVPDKLYRGGAPEPNEIGMLKEHWGIDKIISLSERHGKKIADDCKRHGIEQIIIPIEGDFEQIMHDGASKLIGDKTTYVHCKHGKDRTGAFIGRYRTENGMPAIQALEEAISYGFGIGVDDETLNHYIEFINKGKDAGTPATLEDYHKMKKDTETCLNCGKTKEVNKDCEICAFNDFATKSAKKDAPTESREDSMTTFSNPGDSQSVSDMWAYTESTPGHFASSEFRRGLVKALYEHVKVANPVENNLVQKVTDEERQQAKNLIYNLDILSNLLDIFVLNTINKLVDLFEKNQGINYELIEDVGAENYFINLGKNLKINMYKLVGNKYIDTRRDLKENKLEKDTQENKKTMLDVCTEQLKLFGKDTQLGPIKTSLENLMKDLTNLIIDFGNYLEKELKSENFQEDVLKALKEIQDQCAKIKTLIRERIIVTVYKDVLGENKAEQAQQEQDTNVLQDIINKEKGKHGNY